MILIPDSVIKNANENIIIKSFSNIKNLLSNNTIKSIVKIKKEETGIIIFLIILKNGPRL